MTPTKPLEQSIFLTALELFTPAERDAYLRGACRDDQQLRSAVEELLAAHERANILDNPPIAVIPATDDRKDAHAAQELSGALIGSYKLLEQIGEGGMGTVWMAQQAEPVRRLVAVKLIKAGMDSRQVVARFEAERQALALMEHPNIAHVLDGGTAEGGRPYFVMDLVKGVPITRYCDEQRLTPRQRLELFVPVCEAVQHAHQKGIIHRDLKPSNVLVALYDGEPVPKVIDFGVAKAAGQKLTEKTLFTGFGMIVGTLEYMSPEQAELNNLDIDTRSDIYSLGAVLYELLAGSPPFSRRESEPRGLLEMLRVIREQEPTKPSAKLSTADGLPTLAANRGTEPAKLAKQVRGELDWIVLKALEKDRSRRYESASALTADLQRHLADEPVLACLPSAGYRLKKFARRNRTRLIIASAIGLALLLAVVSLGWMSRERAARDGRTVAGVATLLDQCEDALRADQADRAAIALEAAERRASDGGAEEMAGRLARCRADLRLLRELDDIDLKRRLWIGGRRPDPRPVVAGWRAALTTYGATTDESRAEEAAAKVNGALVRDRVLAVLDLWLASDPNPDVRAVLRAADPDPYREAVRDALAANDPPRVAALAGRPEALDQPPRFATVFGSYRGIEPHRRRELLESALLTRAGNMDLLFGLGETYPPNRPQWAGEKVRWYQAALAAHPGNPGALNNLGSALLVQGKPDRAIACFREAIRLAPNFAIAHTNLGTALRKKGDLDGAIACFRDAIRLDPNLAPAHAGLGSVLLARREVEPAIAELQEAIKIDPNSAAAKTNLGMALWQKGDPGRAGLHLREAVQLDPEDAISRVNLGAYLCDVKRDHDGAINALNEAIRLDPELAVAHYNLGRTWQARGKLDAAIASYKDAIRIDAKLKAAHVNLGAILCDVKREYDGAIACFEAALRLDPNEPLAHANLGNALWGKRNLDRAADEFREAIRLNPNYDKVQNSLAWLLAAGPDGLRDGKEAVGHATRACELTGWKDPGFIETLAAAHAEAGDFDRAVEFMTKALSFRDYAKQFGQDGVERLQLYAQKKPYRDPRLARREPAPPPREVKP